jgi:triacylglycerol lipase
MPTSATVPAPAIPPFEPAFAIDVMLPLAQAAYDVAKGGTLALPAGFNLAGKIVVNEKQFLAAMAVAAASQRRMLDAMKVDGSVFGFTAVNAATKTAIVSFRGTQTLEDWLADFDFVAVPYEPVNKAGNVHMGFQLVYHAVRDSVGQLVQQAVAGGCQDIWVTGHSLGGALALLCAPDLAANVAKAIVPKLYTFAGPRVAQVALLDESFRKFFDGLIPLCYRVANRWDKVPDLPPAIAFYEHVGHGVSVDGGFTLDLAQAHSLQDSYLPGLKKMLGPAAATMVRKVT